MLNRTRGERGEGKREGTGKGERRVELILGLTSTSGRFVAATTVTFDNSSIPSISFNRLVSTPLCGESPSDLEEPRASISSYGNA